MEFVIAGLSCALAISCFWIYFHRREAQALASRCLDGQQKEFAHQMKIAAEKHQAELKVAQEALKAASKEPTYDCHALLRDLTSGAAVVKITPISPMDIYIRRSP